MARKQRVWFPGAEYHVTSRGNRKQALFFDEADRLKYLSLLESTRTAFPFRLHAYCLMTNHVHLLLETADIHIQHIMKEQNFRYAIYFNRKYDVSGHLFEGRYRSEMINSIRYFLEASKYIHLNPVKAEIVQRPEEYRWSSYRSYFNPPRGRTETLVTTEKVLSHYPSLSDYRQFHEMESKDEKAAAFIP